VKRLEDRVALVTGGGQGIGRAIALAFAREGARVAVADQNPETLAEVLAALRALGARAHGIHCDVGVAEDCTRAVEETVQQLGGLGILVNAAAWATTGVDIADVSDDLYRRTVDVCVSSNFWTMRAAFPHLERSGHGSVINFASNAGTEGMAGNAVYAAAKEAIRGLSRSAAKEWGPKGIRVNMIRPIALSPSLREWAEANPKILAATEQGIPLGRLGDCDDDIAPIAVFLASDESRYLTAATIPADGGAGGER
jgi:NAD(P)-dependent dehydrogenase (short-subunit alcohol dehydrogenase family)